MDIYDELLDTPQPDAQPAQGGDAYDTILDEFQAKQTRQLEANLDRALQAMPENAATARELSAATGLPEDLVERNFDQVQRQVRVREMQSALAASPILARQMADPAFAQLAHEDVENLGLIERLSRQFAGGGIEAIGRTVGGTGELADVVSRNLSPAAQAGMPLTALALHYFAPLWRESGDVLTDFAREDVMIPGAQQTFADQVAAGVGQVGAQVLLHALSGGAASLPSMLAQGADIMAERVEDDAAPQWRKDLAVLGGAAVTGLSEKWALDRILGPLAVPVKNQLGAALARIGIAGVSEGGQEFVENVMHEVLRQQLTNPDAEIGIAQGLEEAEVGAAVGVVVRSIVESALHVRLRHQRMEEQTSEAESNAARIEELGRLAAATKLAQVSPATFEQFIEAAAEDGPVHGIFIDANTLMQSGVAEQIAAVSPSVAEQMSEAVATGGMVQIPVAEYAARIAPTEYAQSLLDHIKTDPNGFSRAEAREYLQGQVEAMEADLVERIANVEEQDAFRASQERVKETVLAELNALGRFTEQKNEVDATLIAARTAVRAAQLGITPEELFERQRLRFAAERIDGQQFDQSASPELQRALAMSEDDYIAAVNPEGKQLDAEDRMTLHVGDLDTPPGARRVGAFKDRDGNDVQVLRDDSGIMYAVRDGETLGMMGPLADSETVIDVVEEAKGQGIGRGLAVAYIRENPFAPSGGFTPAGEATRRSAFRQLQSEAQQYGQQPFGGPEEARTPLGDATEVEVDGEMRPALNSEGRSIHPTVEGVRNFWRWFGDEGITDGDNRPSVFIHGGDADFTGIELGRGEFGGIFVLEGNSSGYRDRDFHLYLRGPIATSRDINSFFYSSDDGGKAIIEKAIGKEVTDDELDTIHNAVVEEGWSDASFEDAVGAYPEDAYAVMQRIRAAIAREAGYTAVDIYDEFGGDTILVVDPLAIKSATDNVGTFDPANPNILHQSGLQRHHQRGRRKRDDYTLDLFDVPAETGTDTPTEQPAAGRPAEPLSRDDAPGTYATRTEIVEENQREIGATRVTTPQEAAQAFAYLARGAVERFDALVTDKDGKPLAIVGAFKGALSQASVFPATLTGEAFRIRGAANIWFGHNHPSGSNELSDADRRMNRALTEAFRGSEIQPRGFFAIAGRSDETGGRHWVYESPEGSIDYGATVPPTETARVPVVERILQSEERLGPPVNSPAAAREAVRNIAGGESGVLLMTAQNEPVAFVPVDPEASAALRQDGRMDALYRALSVSNAGAAIVVNNGNLPDATVRNLAGFFNSIDARVLDVMETGGETIKSWAELGQGFGGNIFRQNQRAPRGAYNPATNTIALLKSADLSTFLHEAGHYFFESDIALASELVQESRAFGEEVLTDGERQILRDVSTLLAWHGIQGPIEEQLDTWHNLSFEEKRSAHERTAESFEAYLFEGNAPSIELQPYFQRFREFLKRVYTDLKNFLARHPEAGTLTDEVRAVFDRMLATDEQIELAQQARSMFPLFRTPAEAENVGMTPEEFAAYQAQDPQATADAVQDLQARGLRDLQWTRNARNREIRKLRRQSAAIRREVRMEVRAEVMRRPVYQAWQFLTGKITPEDRITPRERPKSDPNTVDPTVDTLLTAIAKLGGLNKQAVIEEWGVDPAERPNSGVFGKPVLRAGDQGRDIDHMREALGELGYLTLDENGKAGIHEFEELFFDALRGKDVYSRFVDVDLLVEPEPGTSVSPEGLTAGRLDLGALAKMEVAPEVVEVLKARRMTARDGIHPDLLYGLFGFTSSDQMLRELAEATPPREEIEALTDARMLEQYGELATPEAIEIEADKAIHNEARARMIATEANALARAVGQRRVLAQAAKAFAQTMVARVKIRDLRPSQYASAEARAAKAAERASRAGDIVQAAAEKRTQLVNNYATRAAHDARDEVDRGLRYLAKFAKEGTRKGLDVEYLEQIDTLLERFDLRKGQSLLAIDKRTSLAQWIANQEQAGLEPDIPEYILAEANRTHYKNLTVEDFRGLVESVRQIEHLGRLKKKLLTAKDQRELDTIVEEIRERIEQSSGGRIVDNERRETAGSWMRHMFRGALAAHRKAASVVREMDGFEEGGPLWEHLIRTMNERGDWESTMRADAAQRLHDLAKPVLALGPMGGQGEYFPTLGRNLNRGERIAIALNWGNASNRQRLLGGRNWTEAQIQPVLSSLTATEWQFVQGVWDFFESYRPEIAAKERRVYGKEPDWIEPSAFTVATADGQVLEIAGGYYPIKYDPRQSGKAGEFAEAEEAKAMMRAAYTAATTRRSFTKSRAEEVHGRPLLLTFDGIWQGANEVIHDLAWHEWLIDANRLMKRLDSAIRTHYGAEYVDVLRNAIKDIARGDIPATNAIEAALTHVRNGSSIVGMGWNLFTALLQPLGVVNSIVRVGNGNNREGARWIAKGMSQFYGSPRHMLDKVREVQAMSEFMRNRARTMNREIADVRNRLVSDRTEFQMKLEATYFLLIQRAQELVDYPTWLGAYEKAIADPKNLNPDGTVNEARAVALADQAVIDSQSGGTIKDLAQVQRGGPLMKLFTNFYSYFNVLLNMAVEQGKLRVQRKDYTGLMSDYLLLMVVPAVLSAVMREALRGEDDEDEYLKAVASELVGYPFGMFVLGREVAGAVQLAVGVGEPAFGYSGPAGLRFFNEVYKLGQQVGQGDVDMALFKAANNVGGILFHYPAAQVNRAVDGTAALLDGRTDNPLAPLVGPPPPR